MNQRIKINIFFLLSSLFLSNNFYSAFNTLPNPVGSNFTTNPKQTVTFIVRDIDQHSENFSKVIDFSGKNSSVDAKYAVQLSISINCPYNTRKFKVNWSLLGGKIGEQFNKIDSGEFDLALVHRIYDDICYVNSNLMVQIAGKTYSFSGQYIGDQNNIIFPTISFYNTEASCNILQSKDVLQSKQNMLLLPKYETSLNISKDSQLGKMVSSMNKLTKIVGVPLSSEDITKTINFPCRDCLSLCANDGTEILDFTEIPQLANPTIVSMAYGVYILLNLSSDASMLYCLLYDEDGKLLDYKFSLNASFSAQYISSVIIKNGLKFNKCFIKGSYLFDGESGKRVDENCPMLLFLQYTKDGKLTLKK